MCRSGAIRRAANPGKAGHLRVITSPAEIHLWRMLTSLTLTCKLSYLYESYIDRGWFGAIRCPTWTFTGAGNIIVALRGHLVLVAVHTTLVPRIHGFQTSLRPLVDTVCSSLHCCWSAGKSFRVLVALSPAVYPEMGPRRGPTTFLVDCGSIMHTYAEHGSFVHTDDSVLD